MLKRALVSILVVLEDFLVPMEFVWVSISPYSKIWCGRWDASIVVVQTNRGTSSPPCRDYFDPSSLRLSPLSNIPLIGQWAQYRNGRTWLRFLHIPPLCFSSPFSPCTCTSTTHVFCLEGFLDTRSETSLYSSSYLPTSIPPRCLFLFPSPFFPIVPFISIGFRRAFTCIVRTIIQYPGTALSGIIHIPLKRTQYHSDIPFGIGRFIL